MAVQKPEPDGFLAVIERKIAALKTLADSYRAALSLGALGQPGEFDPSILGSTSGRTEGPIELPKGALLGKSLPAAVELYLSSARGKETIREIANALKAGGIESTSDNFENVVTGALHRLKAQGKVLRFKDGWAHADLYPASLRSRPAPRATTAKAKEPRAQKRRVPGRPPKQKATPDSPEQGRIGRPPNGLDKTAAALSFIVEGPASGRSFDEIVEALQRQDAKCSRDYVRVVLNRLRKRDKVERRGERYVVKQQRTNAA